MALRRSALFLLSLVVLPAGVARADILGFGGIGWTVNNGGGFDGSPSIASDVLTLTNDGFNDHHSAFFTTRQSIGSFTASFTYQASGQRQADGVAFVLQNASSLAVGTRNGGSGLGYNVISPSAAVELNIFSDPGTGYYRNGETGHVGGPPYMSTAPVALQSGDPIAVTLTYDGALLTETLRDTITNLMFTHTYVVNLPFDAGGPLAFVGFTGGTGGATSIQTISHFNFGPLTPLSPSLRSSLRCWRSTRDC